MSHSPARLIGPYVIALVLLALFGISIGAGVSRPVNEWKKGQRPSYVPPDFTLAGLDGKEVTLRSQKGKPVVLVFVASWCEVCSQEMPMMVETFLAHRPHDVQFLAVDSMEEREPVEKFRDEFKIPFPILLDTHGRVAQLYGIKGTPTSFFIDRRGLVRDLVIGGPLTRAYLDKEIGPLLEIPSWRSDGESPMPLVRLYPLSGSS